MKRVAQLLLLVALVGALNIALRMGERAAASQTALVGAPGGAAIKQEACTPGDQDPYVYRPARLQVLNPCVHVTGTVTLFEIETDGDVHFRLHLDPSYQSLLVEGNYRAEGDDLVVEPVCYALPLLADALSLCAADPDPVRDLPKLGDRVWMEGRYVLDIGHISWAELHPLYRWGKVSQ